jgi:predicted membrane GTPase involved in stress response
MPLKLGTVTAYASRKCVNNEVKLLLFLVKKVYEGQIVGLCKQKGDLEVNVCKNKKTD